MSSEPINTFLYGALWITSWTAALFFLRFWRASGDRLFAFLAAAFTLLGLQWLTSAVVTWDAASRHEPYVLRLCAFVLILFGIIDKNRRASERASPERSTGERESARERR